MYSGVIQTLPKTKGKKQKAKPGNMLWMQHSYKDASQNPRYKKVYFPHKEIFQFHVPSMIHSIMTFKSWAMFQRIEFQENCDLSVPLSWLSLTSDLARECPLNKHQL